MTRQRSLARTLCAFGVLAVVGGDTAVACELTELEKLTAAEPVAGSWFGRVVGFSGDVAVVGAVIGDFGSAGSAFVFRHTDLGWVEEAELPACFEAECGGGNAVAVSGDVVIVGARGDFVGDGFTTRLYRYAAEDWTEEATFSGTWIHEAIGVDGDVVVLATYTDWPVNDGAEPRVEIHRYDESTWAREAELSLDATSVSISGDVVLVGIAGSAYVYRYDGSAWNEEAELAPTDGAAGHSFACSVSVSGDVALVGAERTDDEDGEPGAAYVFRYSKGAWTQEARLTASGDADESFGQTVTLNGTSAMMGADGAAYVFRYYGDAWEEQAELAPSDAPADGFGTSVAIDGDVALVGAYGGAGAVYAYRGMGDCNENGALDACDVADGTSTDADANGVPDECEGEPDDGDTDDDGDDVNDGDDTPDDDADGDDTSGDQVDEDLDDLLPPCCGTGVCGAGAAGFLPLTLLGMVILKRGNKHAGC